MRMPVQMIRPLWCLRPAIGRRLITTTTTVSAIRPNQPKKKKNHLPYSTPSSPLDFQSRGLRLLETPLPSDIEESISSSGSDDSSEKSRNQKKREARRAVLWGMEIATFTVPQIKRILSAASLDQEVFHAIMTVKRFGHDVREGKRRQFNYIGRLLRDVEPELMNSLILATKDGDQSKLQELSGDEASVAEEDDEDGEEAEHQEEEEADFIVVASRWFDGLVDKDTEITNEVYSIYDIDFDRQELRKLVRRVHNIQSGTGEETEATLVGAKRSLLRFLRSLAKQHGA